MNIPMDWTTVVTALCFLLLTAEVGYLIFKLCRKNRAERIAFLRSFKKGKCVFIYFSVVPLYFIGLLFTGQTVLNSFFFAVSDIINLVVLKFDIKNIAALMAANGFFSVTIYYSFVLVLINALLFALSLTGQWLWMFAQSFKARFSSKDRLYIIGNNESNRCIYRSDKSRAKFIVDNISFADGGKLYSEKIAYLTGQHVLAKAVERCIAEIKKNKDTKREYLFVVNTGSEEKNLEACRFFIETTKGLPQEVKEALFLRLRVFVFGDPSCEGLYENMVASSNGCIHYINKYQRIAINFIKKYPLAKFMDERHIDYSTALVKENVNINVCMIGFGKTNRQVFLTSVANNQFLTQGVHGPELKKVKYHIFDRAEAENNKNLNHSYYRFLHEMEGIKKEDYLPLPSLPAEESYSAMDINDNAFYDRIRSAVQNPRDANFAIIAFGSDLENLDMAQKLSEKRREWGMENLVIFVKVRSLRCGNVLPPTENVYLFANEEAEVFDIEEILGDNIFHMAQMRNEVYDLEYEITQNKGKQVDEAAVGASKLRSLKKWYFDLTPIERESNLFCCLSLRSKLNLMGLDYCAVGANDAPALSEAEYLAVYAGEDMPDTETYGTVCGKKIVNYTLDFQPSKRTNLAVHEHQRWNSFMISRGMIPASIAQIEHETVEKGGKVKFTNGKNYRLRRHGNITTFEGLVTFRKLVALRDGVSEEEKDVIKYDYQLLDDAYWLLSENGFKIVRTQDVPYDKY